MLPLLKNKNKRAHYLSPKHPYTHTMNKLNKRVGHRLKRAKGGGVFIGSKSSMDKDELIFTVLRTFERLVYDSQMFDVI
jgi:hypothetical protein